MGNLKRNSKYGNLVGYREDLGINLKSSMEANYARYLQYLLERGEILGWEYEPRTYYFSEFYNTSPVQYTPDFQVQLLDGTIIIQEVKGRQQSKDRSKWRRFMKHVSSNFEVIGNSTYKLIKNEYKNRIPNWE